LSGLLQALLGQTAKLCQPRLEQRPEKLSFDPDKTLPLATVAESLTEIQFEATILGEIVRSLNERLVEAYWKHAR